MPVPDRVVPGAGSSGGCARFDDPAAHKIIPVVDADDRPIGVLTARVILRDLSGDAEYEEAQMIDFGKGVGYR